MFTTKSNKSISESEMDIISFEVALTMQEANQNENKSTSVKIVSRGLRA